VHRSDQAVVAVAGQRKALAGQRWVGRVAQIVLRVDAAELGGLAVSITL